MKKREKNRKKRFLKHLGKVGMAFMTISLITSPALVSDASDVVGQVIGAEGGRKPAKEALNAALKLAKSKPAMTTATSIVCLACIPVAGAAASPGLCVACGILIAKTFG